MKLKFRVRTVGAYTLPISKDLKYLTNRRRLDCSNRTMWKSGWERLRGNRAGVPVQTSRVPARLSPSDMESDFFFFSQTPQPQMWLACPGEGAGRGRSCRPARIVIANQGGGSTRSRALGKRTAD